MNFSGRPVTAASRVMEIDEVLEATIVCGCRWGQRAWKILRLTCSSSIAELDDQVVIGKAFEIRNWGNALQRGVAVNFGDLAGFQLPSEVSADGIEARLNALLAHIVDADVKSGEGADMRNAAAHLPSTNDADFLDLHVRS